MAFLRVFVSSTFSDLVEDRNVARQVIDVLSADGCEVAWIGMEEFGSYSASPLLVSRDFARVAERGLGNTAGTSYSSLTRLRGRGGAIHRSVTLRQSVAAFDPVVLCNT